MSNPVASVCRQMVKKNKYNILTIPTHEPYEVGLAKTGHNFYSIYGFPNTRQWNQECRPAPKNYNLINKEWFDSYVPLDVSIDFVLSNQKFGQFQTLDQVSKQLHIPHINIEHTLPMDNWPKSYIQQLRSMRANINLYITHYNQEQWQDNDKDSSVIYHGIDLETYKADPNKERKGMLSVANDFINRSHILGFDILQRICKDLPIKIRGNTSNLSTGTKTVDELVNEYQSAEIYICPIRTSPIPMTLLESMACEAVPICNAACALPEIIINGYNGFISNNENTLREYIELCLKDKALCRKLGANARKTIQNKFGMNVFVDKWNEVFKKAAEIRTIW